MTDKVSGNKIATSLYSKDKNFDIAMYFVEISEGGTNNDPDDRGKFTNFGISEKQYPNLDIAGLTINSAKEIYYNDYWIKNKCNNMPKELAIVMFDSGVNCGVSSAAKWLQNSINNMGTDLAVDGIIGPITLSYINNNNYMRIAVAILAHRLKRYSRLIKIDPVQYKFVRGWINRVADLMIYIL